MKEETKVSVHILGRKAFDELLKENGITEDNIEDKKDVCFISINGTYHTETYHGSSIDLGEPYIKTNKENLLNLFFDDVDEDDTVIDLLTGKDIPVKVITEKQAKELFDFIVKNKDKKTFIIHCAAGICRSGAVGLFISEFLNLNKDEFWRVNPQARPNSTVHRLLISQWNTSLQDT